MKRIISIALAALMVVFLMAGCKGGASDASGLYKVSEMNGTPILEYFQKEAEDSGAELNDVLSLFGLSEETISDYWTITLDKDGTVSMTMMGESTEGTWTQDGNTVTITIDDEPMDFAYDNGKLSVTAEGVSVVFQRAD